MRVSRVAKRSGGNKSPQWRLDLTRKEYWQWIPLSRLSSVVYDHWAVKSSNLAPAVNLGDVKAETIPLVSRAKFQNLDYGQGCSWTCSSMMTVL